MASGDGVIRRCHPIVAAYAADYMEQIVVVNCKMKKCLKCEVPPKELGDPDGIYPPRNFKEIQKALASYDTEPDKFSGNCKDAGIKPIVYPFWQNLPYCNIFKAITSDILHQLYQGMVKHMVS